MQVNNPEESLLFSCIFLTAWIGSVKCWPEPCKIWVQGLFVYCYYCYYYFHKFNSYNCWYMIWNECCEYVWSLPLSCLSHQIQVASGSKQENLQITCNDLCRMVKVKYPFSVIPLTDKVMVLVWRVRCMLTLSLDVTISTLIIISLVVGYQKK